MAKIALLIGVSEYGQGLSPIPSAVKDVEAMRRVLAHSEIGQFDQVKTLINPDPTAMQGEIETLFRGRDKGDLILLFFSGHGVKDDRGRLYFATTRTYKMPNGELFKTSAVPVKFIHDVMSDSASKRQVVLIDCCFSGAFADGLAAKDDGSVDVRTQLGGKGRAVLTSTSSTQYAFESEQGESNLSVYTRFLVEGLETGAADLNGKGEISIDELHRYASRKVKESTPAMEPKIYTAEEGFSIVLAKAPIGDPKLSYRKEVENFASRGEISDIARYTLDARQRQLGISAAEAQEIEAQVLKPYQEYKQKLQQYEEVLARALERETVLAAHTCQELKRFQEVLGLEDKDVNSIESKLVTSRDVAQSAPTNSPRPSETASPPVQPQYRGERIDRSQGGARTAAGLTSSLHSIPPSESRTNQQPNQNQIFFRLNGLGQTISQLLSRQPKRVLIFLSIAIATFLLIIVVGFLVRPTTNIPTAGNPSANSSQEQPVSIQDRASFGNRILIENEAGDSGSPAFEAAKQEGAAAMEKGDYRQAVAAYAEAIEQHQNAPETLIYLNNARIGAEKSYVIAASVPISDGKPEPNHALEILRGFAQAQDEINKNGGINGVRLKLKIFDDSDAPEVAKEIATAIVQDPEILGGMGHWSSTTSLSAAPIYKGGNFPFITPISTVVALEKYAPYVFRTNANTRTGGKALVEYALTGLKQKDIAIFYDDKSDYSKEFKSFFSDYIKQGGGEVTAEFKLDNASLDTQASINQAIQQGAKAILLVPAPSSLDKALEVITSNNKQLPLLGDMANLYSPETLKVKEAVGMVMAISWTGADPKSKDFVLRSTDLWNASVNWATAMSYNAAQAMIKALADLTVEPSREEIQKKLAASDLEADGESVPFSFQPSGDAGTSVQLIEVRPNSSEGYSFLPLR